MSEIAAKGISTKCEGTTPLHHHRFPWRMVAMTVLLVAVWMAYLAFTGTRADLAESNLQANLIRITRYLRAPAPDTVMVGSSIAGRLLPDYFPSDMPEVLNLGLDGSRPLFAFEVLQAGPRAPSRVVLETATLFQPLDVNDATLREAMHATTAKLGAKVPFLRPEVRPVTVVYENLKAWREGFGGGRAQAPISGKSNVATGDLPVTYEDVRKAIVGLQSRGTEVILIKIPAGEGWAMPQGGAGRRLADELSLTLLQPGAEIYAQEGDVLRYSDGLHLDSPSAKKVSAWIAARLAKGRNNQAEESQVP
jgi:hypothetical protein